MNTPCHSNLITATALIGTLVDPFKANAAEVPASMTTPVAMLAAPPTAASFPPPLNESQMFSIYGHWDSDLISNVKGGIKTGSALDSVAVGGFTVRGDDLGLANTLFNVSVMGIRTGHANSRLIGDSLGTSNIEGDRNRLLLDTAFWQQNWLTRPGFRLNTRLGMFDLNSEFTTTDNAAQLLNGSFGPDPTMTGNFSASSFPINGTGLVTTLDSGTGKVSPIGDAPLTLKLGIIQGDVNHQTHPLSQGVLNIVEGQWRPKEGTALKVGLWRKRGNGEPDLQGAYFSGEHNLFREGGSSVDGFIRAGTIHGEKHNSLAIDRYLSAGINWQAPFAGRPNDFLTLGVGQARFHPGERHEHLIEFAYIYRVNNRIFLQPDLQYINRPSGTLPAAWVATLRLHIE